MSWNVTSMKQGEPEVAKLEMARVNINILGISEQKWTGMGKFTSVTIISITAGKKPLEVME